MAGPSSIYNIVEGRGRKEPKRVFSKEIALELCLKIRRIFITTNLGVILFSLAYIYWHQKIFNL